MKWLARFNGFLLTTIVFLTLTSNILAAGSCTCDPDGKVYSNETCSINGLTPKCGKTAGNTNWGCVCISNPAIPSSPITNKTPPVDPNNVSILCSDGVSVNTALGCVPVQMDKFIAWLLPYLFGIGGGIAFILMIVGFIQMTTSQGDPKAVQGAKETITSAIVGLLVCLLAIFLLRLITINILHIPGIS